MINVHRLMHDFVGVHFSYSVRSSHEGANLMQKNILPNSGMQATLQSIHERLKGDEEIVHQLGLLDFGSIDRSTITRWRKREKFGKSLPPRAVRAIQLLTRPASRATLNIAYHPTPGALTLVLALIQILGPEVVEVNYLQTEGGRQSLAKLINGEADLALADDQLLSGGPLGDNELPKSCVGLCEVAETRLMGISRHHQNEKQNIRIETIYDLQGKRIGWPSTTAINRILKRDVHVSDSQLIALHCEDDAVEAFKSEKIHCLVAPKHWLEKVQIEVGKCNDIPAGLCGRGSFTLFAHLKQDFPYHIMLRLLQNMDQLSLDDELREKYLRKFDKYKMKKFFPGFDPEELRERTSKQLAHYQLQLRTRATLEIWMRDRGHLQ